jgi:hypothetical protein
MNRKWMAASLVAALALLTVACSSPEDRRREGLKTHVKDGNWGVDQTIRPGIWSLPGRVLGKDEVCDWSIINNNDPGRFVSHFHDVGPDTVIARQIILAKGQLFNFFGCGEAIWIKY